MAEGEVEAAGRRLPVVVESRINNEALLAQRRATLIEAATGLFLRQGFHRTSVREIAEAANMTVGALYQYIGRKEDILYLVSDATMTELSEGLLETRPRDPAREWLAAAMERLFETADRLARQILLVYRETSSLPRAQRDALKDSELREREYLARILRYGMSSGEFRRVNAELVAHNIIVLAHMWGLKSWSFPEFSSEQFRYEQQELILSSILRTQTP